MLARSTLIYAPAILAPRAAAFALVLLLSHALPRAEFGLYALVIVVGEMLDMAASNWIRLSLLRLDIGDPGAWRNGLVQGALLSCGVLLILAAPAAFASSALVHDRAMAFTLIVLAYAAAMGALRLGLTALQLLRRDAAYSAVEVARAVLLTMGAIVAAMLSPRFETLALVNAGAAAIGALACLAYAWRALPTGEGGAAPLSARLSYGAPLIAVGLASSVVASADRIGLKLLAGAAAVGAYAAAYALARAPLDVIANAVNQGGFPEMMRRQEAEGPQAAADFTRDAFELQSLLLAGAGAGLIGVTPALAGLLLPTDYRAFTAAATPLIALGAVLLSIKTFVFDNVFHALKRNLAQAATYLPAGAVTLLACVLLIPHAGPSGAAAAFALGSAAGLAASAAYAFRNLPVRLRPRELAKALGAALAAGGVARAIADVTAHPFPAVLFGTAGGAVAWTVVVAFARPLALMDLHAWADDLLPALPWPIRRLSRMSLAEVAYRLRTAAIQTFDAAKPPGWARFERETTPSAANLAIAFDRASPAMLEVARSEARRAMAGDFDYLGQAWPPLKSGWVRGEAWRLDPVSSRPWPEARWRHASATQGLGDVKYVWELNRLPFLGAVGLAAAHGDEDARAFGYAALAGWMEAHPPYAGLAWRSGVEIASRIAAVSLFIACASPPSEEDGARVRAFVIAHAERLARYPSLHSSANNHRVAELTGLVLAASAIPTHARSKAWVAQASAGLEDMIGHIFHADGVGAEQSPSYAAYSLEWFVLAGLAADAAGTPVSASYRRAALRAAETLRWMLDDAGRPPRIGDDDEGRVLTLRQAPETRYVASVVAFARRWLGEAPLHPALHDPDLRDLLGPPASAPPVAAPTGARTFPDGGLTVFRTDTPQGPAVLAFDHGPLGHLSIAAHGHADALSVTLSWGDEPVLTDPGTYLYHSGGAARDALRGTAAHNTLCIDGSDQSRILGPFAWDRHARTTLLTADDASVEAEHDGYLRRYGVRHRRQVRSIERHTFQISDHVAGRAARAFDWTAGFTLAPGCEATVNDQTAVIQTSGGRTVVLVVEGDAAGWSLRETPFSPRFSRLHTTTRLQLAGRVAQGAETTAFAVTIRLEGAGA